MLVIREQQSAAFREYMVKQFGLRMLAYLTVAYPEKTSAIGGVELRALVFRGIQEANAYNLKTERTTQRYLEYLVLQGSDFGSTPETEWAGAILRRTDLTGSAKMDHIDDRYRAQSRDS